jgi:Transposase IS66 family
VDCGLRLTKLTPNEANHDPVCLTLSELLPSERVRELLSEVLDCKLSEGILYNAREYCYGQLETVEQHLKEGMQTAEVGHSDETGVRVKGKLMRVKCP